MKIAKGSTFTSALFAIAGAGLLGVAGYSMTAGGGLCSLTGGTCGHAEQAPTIANASAETVASKQCPASATCSETKASSEMIATKNATAGESCCPMTSARQVAAMQSTNMFAAEAATSVIVPAAFFNAAASVDRTNLISASAKDCGDAGSCDKASKTDCSGSSAKPSDCGEKGDDCGGKTAEAGEPVACNKGGGDDGGGKTIAIAN